MAQAAAGKGRIICKAFNWSFSIPPLPELRLHRGERVIRHGRSSAADRPQQSAFASVRKTHQVEPDRLCSPRHGMPVKSRNEVSNNLMTCRATSVTQTYIAGHVIGCHVTQETRVKMTLMMWRATCVRPYHQAEVRYRFQLEDDIQLRTRRARVARTGQQGRTLVHFLSSREQFM